MSSDNFLVVRRDPNDRTYVVSMGFASDGLADCKVPVGERDARYATEDEAFDAAFTSHSEYGVGSASWCLDVDGHRADCSDGR